MKIKFVNALALLKENEEYVLKKQEVLIENNLIKTVADCINENADRIIDVKENILMSGFVNSHAHNVMTLLRGIKNDVSLQTWLFDYIFPNEKKLTPSDIYWGEMLGIAESVRSGITCFEENYFHFEKIIQAVNKSQIRARIGIGKDFCGNSLQEDLTKTLKLFTNKDLVKPVVYPHSIYTVSEEDMETFVTFAKNNNLPVSTHLSETLKEVGECINLRKQTPPQYLESMGFFDRNATLYHCVHMDKDDTQILQSYNVNIVTCPSSNLKLASGFAPIYSFLQKGLNVAIGTDGPASNDSIDMFKEMFLVATLQKAYLGESEAITVCQVLDMATINGAKALGYDKLGKIEEGYLADIILVDVNGLHHMPKNNLISNLVYSAKSSDVYFTMVNGNILYENGQFNLGEDINTIKQNCEKIAKKFN